MIALHPAASGSYQQQLRNLSASLNLNASDHDSEAGKAIRDLIEKVIVYKDGAGLTVEIPGRLTKIISQTFPRVEGNDGSGGGTRTPDPRIMIPVL